MNDLLSICIPTYNRAQMLRGCLENLIPQVKKHGIAIYVSDNHSTDDTVKVILGLKREYHRIFVNRNPRNIGAERNFRKVLGMSKTRYSWLLGDTYRIVDGAIDAILKKLRSKRFDLVIVNAGDKVKNKNELVNKRVRDIKTDRIYTDQNRLLADIGWHTDLLSGLIFGSNIIKAGRFAKYFGTNLVQVGTVFDYLATRKFSAYWYSRPVVYKYGTVQWYREAFEIFAKKWPRLICSLPAVYTVDAKKKCIKDHGVKSRLFVFSRFILLRSGGHYTYEHYKKYRSYFPYVTNVPGPILLVLSLMPPIPEAVICAAKKIVHYLRRLDKG